VQTWEIEAVDLRKEGGFAGDALLTTKQAADLIHFLWANIELNQSNLFFFFDHFLFARHCSVAPHLRLGLHLLRSYDGIFLPLSTLWSHCCGVIVSIPVWSILTLDRFGNHLLRPSGRRPNYPNHRRVAFDFWRPIDPLTSSAQFLLPSPKHGRFRVVPNLSSKPSPVCV
jgi:hypothetical protein